MTARPDLDAIERDMEKELRATNRLAPNHAYGLLNIARIQESKIKHAYKEIRALEAERDDLVTRLREAETILAREPEICPSSYWERP